MHNPLHEITHSATRIIGFERFQMLFKSVLQGVIMVKHQNILWA